jgi:hypothetical protein
MTFEARYIDVHSPDGSAADVVAIWCVLNGRFRRFTAENVRELQHAGHHFFVHDAASAAHAVHVIEASLHLHTHAAGLERNLLVELPGWGLHGSSAGHSTRPPPSAS